MPPKELAQVLRSLPPIHDPRLAVGPASFDDAGVYVLSKDLALVQTVDFFPPIIDDPFQFGQVAAANSLSDVYAMGGEPLTALSLVCFPNTELDLSVLGDILRGGADKCAEAGCTIVGGHSVRDPEIKFGFSVTGTIHPDRVASNAGAKVGDRLFLTKPLGTGATTTAFRKKAISGEVMAVSIKQMAALNKAAADSMRALGINTAIHAATDITGFGLLGHARNIAAASGVKLVFRAGALPLVVGAREFAAKKMSSGAYKQNQDLLQSLVELPAAFDEALHRIIFDAETSGGLLIAVAPEKGDALLADLKRRGVSQAVEVGFIEPAGSALLKII
ncbi:MAG TPA: selenide, water dikinase SelD [Planctomycetota bacterium]|nr:selenide, water dikinase SelD [Planctomycetota bacterium]